MPQGASRQLAGARPAALVSLLAARPDLRGAHVLADQLDEAITWGI